MTKRDMTAISSRYATLLRDFCKQHQGTVFSANNDSFWIDFATPGDALDVAVAVQSQL